MSIVTRKNGITVFQGLIPERRARELATRVIEMAEAGEVPLRDAMVGEEGNAFNPPRRLCYGVLDGVAVRMWLPELCGVYWAAGAVMEQVTFERPILDKYEVSDINVKVYKAGSEHGWHHDTNPLTGLLYLTDTRLSVPTEIQTPEGEIINVHAGPGDFLIFNGRELLHRVPPWEGAEGEWRVTVPFNYYTEALPERESYIDALLYGSGKST